jgi:hypothetical protein
VSSGSNQPLQNGVTGTGSRDISLSDSSTLRIIVGSSWADGYVSTDISTWSLLSLKDGSFDEKALLGMNSGSGGSGSGTGGGGGNSCPMNPTAESYFTFEIIPSSVTSIGADAFGGQNNSAWNGTVYGPSSGYIKSTYTINSSWQFDKTKLTNYVDTP